MTITPGSRLGPYEVIGPLGAGGMGEVYRARDARLHREVALKILPEAFASDPERLGRFEREAQALAALKHPHIATIYGMHDEPTAGGGHVRALVLELIDGDTLADRLARGPIPVDEAASIARQIADALEAAHDQGIIHRDLKPANIKITADGSVKVLDFGLAKLEAGGDSLDVTSLATMTSPAVVTGVSVLLGTAGYMAPEQARGRTVDKRADIWAFGVVLYEMLAGRRAFEGETVTEVIAAVIHKDVDWSALPPQTPASLRALLRQCLQKDPKQRLRDIGDARLLLEGAFALPAAPVAAAAVPARRSWVPVTAIAVLAAAISGAAVWFLTRPEPAPRVPLRFEIGGRAAQGVGAGISPDGRFIGYIDVNPQQPRLVMHSLEAGRPQEVEGLSIVGRAGPGFWSEDSRSVGMWIDGRIVRLDLAGGAPQMLAEAGSFGGAAWSTRDVILFADQDGIKRVPASGGAVEPVTSIERDRNETSHTVPAFLPDGEHFLYVRESGDAALAGVYVGRVDAAPGEQDRTRLLNSTSQALFVAGDDGDAGHLLYLRDGVLTARPFNAATRRLTGDPFPVLDERVASQGPFGMFSVSGTGTLVYRAATSAISTLVAASRTGQRETLLGGLKLEGASSPRLSPDGRRVVVVLGGDLWSYDLSGRPPIKLTFDGDKFSPVWTPDGTHVIYEQGGSRLPEGVFSVPADGTGGTPSAVAPDGHFHPHGWASNGDLVAVRLEGGNVDLYRFAPRADATPQPVQQTPALEGLSAAASPDGRWVAFTADTTGRQEVWVRSLTASGAPVRVSPNGGSDPVWARNGRELYYREGNRLMAVASDAGEAFNFKPPVELFTALMNANQQPPVYDVDATGRFIFLAPEDARDVPISVILDFPELLRTRAATR